MRKIATVLNGCVRSSERDAWSDRPVGLVVNPHAAHDIRRLTSLAPVMDGHRLANIVARVLRGLAAGGVTEALYMVEPTRVVERAATLCDAAPPSWGHAPELTPAGALALDAPATSDTARAMRAAGAACVVVVGGDGTHRAVATGWPEVVVASVPAGTNNAFAEVVDPTVLGLAAAAYAVDPEAHAPHVRQTTRLDVALDGHGAVMALVDVSSVHGSWVGSRAVWDPTQLVEAVVTRADPTRHGIAGLAGMIGASPAAALHIRFGQPGRTVLAPLGPGQVMPTSIRAVDRLDLGDTTVLAGGVTLAFDGERELVLPPGRQARVTVAAGGPQVITAADLVRAAARAGRFTDPAGARHVAGCCP